MLGSIESSLSAGVLRLTISDPERLNAMTPALADDLRAKLQAIGDEVRVVALAGAGKHFCSGANLADVLADPEARADGGAMLERHYNPLIQTIRNLPVPLITSVRGAAVGVGASLALSGDLIIASDTAYFLQAFRRIGLAPDGGAPFILTQAIGRVRALELMLLAEKLSAQRALEWGLVTRVAADDQLDATVDALAKEMAEGASFALGKIRQMAWAATQSSLDQALALEVEVQRAAAATADFQEGLAAFLEKRPARFIGR
ncbi:MAG: enoyl-CoA hydratase-related protein [Hyphomonadaceae bacterium]